MWNAIPHRESENPYMYGLVSAVHGDRQTIRCPRLIGLCLHTQTVSCSMPEGAVVFCCYSILSDSMTEVSREQSFHLKKTWTSRKYSRWTSLSTGGPYPTLNIYHSKHNFVKYWMSFVRVLPKTNGEKGESL